MRFLGHPHHDGSSLYVSENQVWVRLPAHFPAEEVYVRSVVDGEPRFTVATLDESRTGRAIGGYGADDRWLTAVIPARNPVTPYRFFFPGGRWLTAAGLVDHDVPDGTDFKLVTHAPPPEWAADAIIYQIFPDRFAGSLTGKQLPEWAIPAKWDTDPVIPHGPGVSSQVYGGDLDGIIGHLDHIEALGVNTVYLTPVFPGRSNHRYDAATFDYADPLLGGNAALTRLRDALHSRGMRLIGDITTNHVGDLHEWFATCPEMFYFDDAGGYESWCGVKELPKLNWNSPLTRERMTGVMRQWLSHFDGWRVDVANMTGRCAGDDLTHQIARDLRQALPAGVMFVAEHAHDATGDLDRDGWQGTMNYAGFTRPVWSWLRGEDCDLPYFMGYPGGIPARDGLSILDTMRAFSGRMSWRSYTHSWQLLDSHDSARVRTVAGSFDSHLLALGLQACLPGTPMIFMGSEFGLPGVNGEHSRTPMPWNRPEDRHQPTLEAYQALLRLRRDSPALRRGGLRWIHADADSLVFLREQEHESILVSVARKGTVDPPIKGTVLYQAGGLSISRIVTPG
jgi:alpha-glucosidase